MSKTPKGLINLKAQMEYLLKLNACNYCKHRCMSNWSESSKELCYKCSQKDKFEMSTHFVKKFKEDLDAIYNAR